jgi:RimJ/RimL family protein N-acetyltransferase
VSVISITDPPNQRSLAVMQRLGMAFDEAEVQEEGETVKAVVYSLTAEQWRSHRSRR